MDRHRVSPKMWTPRAISSAISDARNALVSPAEYAALAQTPLAKAVAPVYDDLDAAFRAANAVSFDDLLGLPGAAAHRARRRARTLRAAGSA